MILWQDKIPGGHTSPHSVPTHPSTPKTLVGHSSWFCLASYGCGFTTKNTFLSLSEPTAGWGFGHFTKKRMASDLDPGPEPVAEGQAIQYGSRVNQQGTAGFSPWFHLPVFHFGYPFLTHIHFGASASFMTTLVSSVRFLSQREAEPSDTPVPSAAQYLRLAFIRPRSTNIMAQWIAHQLHMAQIDCSEGASWSTRFWMTTSSQCPWWSMPRRGRSSLQLRRLTWGKPSAGCLRGLKWLYSGSTLVVDPRFCFAWGTTKLTSAFFLTRSFIILLV